MRGQKRERERDRHRERERAKEREREREIGRSLSFRFARDKHPPLLATALTQRDVLQLMTQVAIREYILLYSLALLMLL
jgi:hypothetical protein